jgi:hypothetical protein
MSMKFRGRGIDFQAKNSKCSDRTVENCAIKFTKDVGSSEVSCDDYERTEVSWTHFAIEGLLDLCISHEY